MARAASIALKKLARSLRALADVSSRVSTPFAGFITDRLREGVLRGQDPYGNPLAPLKAATVRRKGHARILQGLTLTLLNTVQAVTLGRSGVGLDGGPSYGAFHIIGTSEMVARPYLPINVLPAKWRAELARLVHAAAVKALK